MERDVALGALRRFGPGVFRRGPLIGSPPALERLFIASTIGQGIVPETTAQTKSGLFVLLNSSYPATNSSSSAFASFRSRVSNPSVNHP